MHIQRKTFPSISPLVLGAQKIHYPQLSVKHFYDHQIKWKILWCGRSQIWQKCNTLAKLFFFYSYKSQDKSLHALEKIGLLIISISPWSLKLLNVSSLQNIFIFNTFNRYHQNGCAYKRRHYFFLSEDRKPEEIYRGYLHLMSLAKCAHLVSHINIRAILMCPNTATAKETWSPSLD